MTVSVSKKVFSIGVQCNSAVSQVDSGINRNMARSACARVQLKCKVLSSSYKCKKCPVGGHTAVSESTGKEYARSGKEYLLKMQKKFFDNLRLCELPNSHNLRYW